MRTLRVAILALGLAAIATGCSKKKDTTTPATDTAAETTPAEGEANPCGDGAANPCGEANPCGAAADPCGGGE